MGEQASMKPFAALLQATVVVLAVVFVFATDVAADPDDGLPVEDLATEAFPKVEDLATEEGQDVGSSANSVQFTCEKQCFQDPAYKSSRVYCCWCGSSEGEYKTYMTDTSWGQNHHGPCSGSCMTSGLFWMRPQFVTDCFHAKKQWCKSNCWNHGEILAEKSPTASRKDSLDLEDLLAGVRGDDTDKEDTDSLTDVQARVHDGICRPPGGTWG